MDIALPDTVTAETLEQARGAADVLQTLLAAKRLPEGLDATGLNALLTVARGVIEAAAEDQTDLSPSEAAARLRMARPSVMRLISRGELSARKDGGHYVLSPREVRMFQIRLSSARRDVLSGMTAMAEEFGF